jgi:hypothetical protein
LAADAGSVISYLPVARQGWAEKLRRDAFRNRHRKKLLSPRQSDEPKATLEKIDTPYAIRFAGC